MAAHAASAPQAPQAPQAAGAPCLKALIARDAKLDPLLDPLLIGFMINDVGDQSVSDFANLFPADSYAQDLDAEI